MELKKVTLFASHSKIFFFVSFLLLLFTLSMGYKYYQYKIFTQFDTIDLRAHILKHYTKTITTKTGKTRTITLIQARTPYTFTFYTMVANTTRNLKGQDVYIRLWVDKLSFYTFLQGTYLWGKLLKILPKKEPLAYIYAQHTNTQLQTLYGALFFAQPLPSTMQQQLSKLGIAHLIALSGLHLTILASLIALLFLMIYKPLHAHYFPYRDTHRDIFFFTSILLGIYLWYVDMPPSLLRSYTMYLVAMILYFRGYQLFSMQTLFISVAILIALEYHLLFSLGMYLSVGGVFYIFVYLQYMRHQKWWINAVALPIWVYLAMLPYSITLFGYFSTVHPFSIIISILFSIFYPLTLILHIIGMGDLLDPFVLKLLDYDTHAITLHTQPLWVIIQLFLSALAPLHKYAFLALFIYCLTFFIHLVYNVAQL